MDNKKPKGMPKDEIRVLMDSAFKIMDARKQNKDLLDTEVDFLRMYVERLFTKMLTTCAEKVNKKAAPIQQETMTTNFLLMKLAVQEAVAIGLQSAIQEYSHHAIEYVCRLEALKDVTSEYYN